VAEPGISSPGTATRLWLAQRVSAAILALAVVLHLGTIIYAVRGGVTASEIVDRIGGNLGWWPFYTEYVLAAAVHAPIGLRVVLREMTPIVPRRVDLICFGFSALLAVLGMRVVMRFYAIGAG